MYADYYTSKAPQPIQMLFFRCWERGIYVQPANLTPHSSHQWTILYIKVVRVCIASFEILRILHHANLSCLVKVSITFNLVTEAITYP